MLLTIALFLLFNSMALLAQDNLFDSYLLAVEKKEITNTTNYLEKIEKKFFNDISQFADELSFTENDINFISAKDSFDTSFNTWSTHSKKIDIKLILKRIAKDPKYVITSSDIKSILKENRKFAHLMRESYYVFDNTHLAPENLENFVKPFGKLNDAIITKDEKLISKYATKVLKNLNQIDEMNLKNSFHSINKKQFLSYFGSIKTEIDSIFNKKVTTPHDFHTLRKQYKRFLYIYHNLDTYIPHSKLIKLDNFISKFGEVNDIYTDMKFRLGLDLHRYEINFPKNFKFEILDTIKFLEQDMQSIQLGKSCSSFYRFN